MFSFPLDKTQLFWQAQAGQSVRFGNTLHAWTYTSVILHAAWLRCSASLQEDLARKRSGRIGERGRLQRAASLTQHPAAFGGTGRAPPEITLGAAALLTPACTHRAPAAPRPSPPLPTCASEPLPKASAKGFVSKAFPDQQPFCILASSRVRAALPVPIPS